MSNWTKKNIPDLSEKVFIITGANSGIGYESTLALAEKGATVIMACRNHERAQQSLEAIRQKISSANLDLIELNLASLKSIRSFANSFKSKYNKLDGLVNNGGPIIAPRNVTEDGFESHFGVNHLGHFALTGLLLDLLLNTPSSRVVTVSSRMHVDGKMKWDDLMSEHSYDRMAAYRQSKLAQLLFAFELNQKLQAKGVSTMSVAAHPGLAKTSWADNNLSGIKKIMGKIMSAASYQSAAMGALPILYAAVNSNVRPGGYYGPENDTKGFPTEILASDYAYNDPDAKRLWEMSESLTGVKYKALGL
jgi:NAD(P)-dependent dehydrogenase (short-subunit alcohol dehydrogenase family)